MIYEKKVKINNMINNVKDKNVLKEIFFAVESELTSNGECKYTFNNNGIFFDLNILSDETLLRIEKILNCNINESDTETMKYNMYSTEDNIVDSKSVPEYKLSNKEKNVMNIIQKQKV